MPEALHLVVDTVRDVAEDIRAIVFVAEDGGALPPFPAGAHLRFDVPITDGDACVREYSLVGDPRDRSRYEIAVLREPAGRGGSARMHALREGDAVTAHGPIDGFSLAGDATEHLLVAGGIGVTPLLCMARVLRAGGAATEIHYAARSEARMAYRAELEALGARLYFDGGDPTRGVPLAGLLAEPRAGRHLYVCGPAAMIAATLDAAERAGWPAERVHHESFGGAIARSGDRPIRVHLRASQRTVDVAADESILDALLREGIDPLYDCRRGECGLCVVDVLDGVPEHRDHVLSARERDGGRVMCTCVSRAKTAELAIDL